MRLLIPMAIAALLSGCALRHPQPVFGSFTGNQTAADSRKIADDVAKKLAALYPPARSRLNLRHGTPDSFGTALIQSLRARGYAVAEFKAGSGAARPALGSYQVAYIINQLLDAGTVRVTVHLNEQSLTRLYVAKDGVTSPAGYWVRKE